jgi:DNA topoisomerase-3
MECPICKGQIMETEFVFECENHEFKKDTNEHSGCNFIIFRQLLNKKISRETFEKLLSGKTLSVKNFENKKKKKFDADIKLEKNEDGEYKIKLIFKNNLEKLDEI